MRIEEALVYRIENIAAVAAIIGDRIYPLTRTQDEAMPAVTYLLLPATGLPAHDGPSRLQRTRVQIDSWSRDRLQAHAISDLIRDDLDGFRGTMGEAPGLDVPAVRWDSGGADVWEPGPKLYRVRDDYFVTHQKP